MSDKILKNYIYDNPELQDLRLKKSSNIDLDDEDLEVWLLQCPKNVDPKMIFDMGKKAKVECHADRFDEKKTLALITPAKAAEYEKYGDSIQLIEPVGKIFVTEVFEVERTNSSSDEENNKAGDVSYLEVKPITGKKIKKKLNDQRFTIETTVTVQNIEKRKIKKDKESQEFSSPEAKRKSKNSWKL